jgi:hypothetical protein
MTLPPIGIGTGREICIAGSVEISLTLTLSRREREPERNTSPQPHSLPPSPHAYSRHFASAGRLAVFVPSGRNSSVNRVR